jgi:hypothetical protein
MLRNFNLRRAGLVLATLGIGAAAILLTTYAWLSRKNNSAFNASVGWANIASLTVAAIGVMLVMAEKVGALTHLSRARMAGIADDLSREATRQDGLLLAQLLSTDALDSRAAQLTFRTGKAYGRQRSRGKRSKPLSRDFTDIIDFYLNETRRRMVILGGPGTGKTVLAVFLTVGLLQRRAAAPEDQKEAIPVPCLFNLPSWDPERHEMTYWLETQIVERFRVSRKIAAKLVRDGWIFPVLDGLDEMDSQEAIPRRSESAVARINDYIARTPNSQIVVVCRSGDNYYGRLIRGVRDADEIFVQNLKGGEIIDYVETQCPDESTLATWQPVFDALTSKNPSLVLSVLNTPWRMTAAVTFVLNGGDPAALLPTQEERTKPDRRSEYSLRVSKLLMETFVTARIAIHSKRQIPLSPTVAQLRIVAKMLTEMEGAGKAGKEIILHQWWNAFERRKILGAHLFVVWGALHLPFAVIPYFLNTPPAKNEKGLFTLIAVMVNYITIFLFSTQLAARRKGPITLRIGNLRSPRFAATAMFAVIISGFFGWIAALAYGILYGIGTGASSAGIMILITASSGLDPIDATHPKATLIGDRNFAIIIGTVIWAYVTLYYVTLYGLEIAFIFASMCFLGSVFSSSYVRYLVAAYLGGRRGIPMRFAVFLDRCHSAGILRISGIGYQFRHQELLDYLTDSQ